MSGKKRSPLPQHVRFDVLRRDGFRCRYCGRASAEGVVLHVDHVVAVSAGGATEHANLVTACSDCNFGKAAKPVAAAPAPAGGGNVVGWFGHRLDSRGWHKNQFQIVEHLTGDRYAIQLFSYLDGCPTNVEVVSADNLFSEEFALYRIEAEWRYAAEVDAKRRVDWRAD